jgi:predicted  nucleic acid-binding Zn ribbon protein
MKGNKEFNRLYAEYAKKYDLVGLDNPNDISNLRTMIYNQLMIDQLQENMQKSIQDGEDLSPDMLKKSLDSITTLSQQNLRLESQLGIDRKTRKDGQADDFATYLTQLKQTAKEFMDKRITKVFCKSCNIMVGRISGVYDTTAFEAAFQCPQCKKQAVVKRKERDIFFDQKDPDWRRKYPMEVIQPKRISDKALSVFDDDEDDDLHLSNEG